MASPALHLVRRDVAHDDETLFNELGAWVVERADLPMMSWLWNDTSDIGRGKPEVRPYTANQRFIVGGRLLLP